MNKIEFFKRTSGVNLDITFRCPLECPRCSRQIHWRDKGLRVPGRDITIEEFESIKTYVQDSLGLPFMMFEKTKPFFIIYIKFIIILI